MTQGSKYNRDQDIVQHRQQWTKFSKSWSDGFFLLMPKGLQFFPHEKITQIGKILFCDETLLAGSSQFLSFASIAQYWHQKSKFLLVCLIHSLHLCSPTVLANSLKKIGWGTPCTPRRVCKLICSRIKESVTVCHWPGLCVAKSAVGSFCGWRHYVYLHAGATARGLISNSCEKVVWLEKPIKYTTRRVRM